MVSSSTAMSVMALVSWSSWSWSCCPLRGNPPPEGCWTRRPPTTLKRGAATVSGRPNTGTWGGLGCSWVRSDGSWERSDDSWGGQLAAPLLLLCAGTANSRSSLDIASSCKGHLPCKMYRYWAYLFHISTYSMVRGAGMSTFLRY